MWKIKIYYQLSWRVRIKNKTKPPSCSPPLLPRLCCTPSFPPPLPLSPTVVWGIRAAVSVFQLLSAAPAYVYFSLLLSHSVQSFVSCFCMGILCTGYSPWAAVSGRKTCPSLGSSPQAAASSKVHMHPPAPAWAPPQLQYGGPAWSS